jgi:error-prone DNA polymerase
VIPLWCKSNFSFLEGASHPEELVASAQALGLPALGLTDRDGIYGMVRAHVAAKEMQVKLLVGSELTVANDSKIVLLAQTREGYKNLCHLISQGRLRSEKGESLIHWEEVCARAQGLIALWYDALAAEPSPAPIANLLKEAFNDRVYALLPRHLEADESPKEARVRERSQRLSLPLVATQEILYHHVARRPLQDVLTCIRHGVTLATAGRRIKANTHHALRSKDAMARLFADVPDAVARTYEIASGCTFSMSELRYRYPSERLPSGLTSMQWLEELCIAGAHKRYGAVLSEAVQKQLRHELKLIDKLDYPGYFLTMYEIVEYCRRSDILCQGRGSAANSIVCYALFITSIDPIKNGLLFERFISEERPEPPDIDLDIAHERREEVIQHMYEKYGRTHAAMVANVIRYRAKSALRDVGKVLGFSETALDRLAKMFSHFADNLDAPPAGHFDALNPMHEKLLSLAKEILDFPRHLSIHPGGFLLGHEPVSDLVPIENATMPDRTVIQWDKRDVEELGLFKVDLLGLGALTQLDMCFKLLETHRGVSLTMATIPQDDEKTYAMCQRADTVGVFQIESRAQMSMLPRLKPKVLYDLVIQVSIVRPGPITGGMVHPYLRRRQALEDVDYPHPSLKPVLEKTLGIPLFQEQVMKLAVVAADYTPGEADQLRRDMAAWKSTGRIEQHKEKLISRMQKKGIAPEFAERVFNQIRGFGEYGFPESHAASFALIAYATAYMRAHHLDVFTCALLNAQPMGFYSPSTIIDDARRHGLVVWPIDIKKSAWDCTIEGACVRMGFRYIKGVSQTDYPRIDAARAVDTPALFAERSRLSADVLTLLAEADAFASFGIDRRQALWALKRRSGEPAPEKGLGMRDDEAQLRFRALTATETINWDYTSSRHSTRGHVLQTLRQHLRAQSLPAASDVAALKDGVRVRYAGMVICRQRPGTASGVTFLTLEDETGFVNVVVWRKVFAAFETVLRTTSFLGVMGRVQNEDGVLHVIAEGFFRPQTAEIPSDVASHDFH